MSLDFNKISKSEVLETLKEMILFLQLKGENPFRIQAYENAVDALENSQEDLSIFIEKNKLTDLQGIGKGLAEVILEIVQTGTCKKLEQLRFEFPPSLLDLLKVQGLGPKKIKSLFMELGIQSLKDLEEACQQDQLVNLKGFGLKTQEKISQHLEFIKKAKGAFLFPDALDFAFQLKERISSWKNIQNLSLAGELRRSLEVIRKVDLVCSSSHPEKVLLEFKNQKEIQKVFLEKTNQVLAKFSPGLDVNFVCVLEEEFPFAFRFYTGSEAHNKMLEEKASQKGFRLGPLGLWKGRKKILCQTEGEIFQTLGMSFIPPELRENQKEISWALQHKIPQLIGMENLRGLLHIHSNCSDGIFSMEEIVQEAQKKKYEYVGFADHSQSAFYAHGLKKEEVVQQRKEIQELQKKYSSLRIFQGIESDILPDGSLDYPDSILQKFDFVIGSVHSRFNMTESEMTQRCCKALENPFCTILGHPTGRLLLTREGFSINLTQVIDHAARYKKMIELNSNPYRLDLDWRWIQYAKEKKVMISIDPDSHDLEGLDHVRFGISIARKGGLIPKEVLNTRSPQEVEERFEKIRTQKRTGTNSVHS